MKPSAAATGFAGFMIDSLLDCPTDINHTTDPTLPALAPVVDAYNHSIPFDPQLQSGQTQLDLMATMSTVPS